MIPCRSSLCSSVELRSLTWQQIDLAEGTIRLEPGTTKNKDGRLIYLTQELRALIQGQWQEHETRYPDCPYVFSDHGQRIVNYDKRWREACQKAEHPGKLMHDFRRTAIRNLVRAGIPERVAMQMSGHKTRSIFDRYHIVADSDLQEAAKRLEHAMSGQTMTKTMTMTAFLPSKKPVSH